LHPRMLPTTWPHSLRIHPEEKQTQNRFIMD